MGEQGPQQPIKPGDVVGYDRDVQRTRYLVGVVDHGWATIVAGPGSIMDAPVRTLLFREHGTEDEERAAVLAVAELHRGDHRRLARTEALRRGWRALDREDGIEEPYLIHIRVEGRVIGYIENHTPDDGPPLWSWVHWSPSVDRLGNGRETGKGARAAAKAALIAAENARRATEVGRG